jgi:hypothetical protein
VAAGGNVASVHPIERLRYVARADGAGPVQLTLAAARALAGLGDDRASLVTGCRQMVDRHPGVGTLWWLAARLLTADDIDVEAWAVSDELHNDSTTRTLSDQLPADAMVAVLGYPETVAPALYRRGDIEVLVIDALREGPALVDSLISSDVSAIEVPESGLGSAVAEAGLVVLEVSALGPEGMVAVTGSRAAAAVAHHAGIPVWAVAASGRTLPRALWEALTRRLDDLGDPWDSDFDLVPADLVDVVVGPWGMGSWADAVAHTDCPIAPELYKGVFAPGTRR